MLAMEWEACDTGAGMAIEPGIAAMANTSAITKLIHVRTGHFPNFILCKVELIQTKCKLAHRRRAQLRAIVTAGEINIVPLTMI